MQAFDAIDISDSRFEVLHDDVVVTEMTFDERITTGGIILRNDNGTGYGIRPRWGRVYATGPDQRDVRIGDWICVAHGRWTRGIQITDAGVTVTVRKVDPNEILLVSDVAPGDDTLSTAVHVDKQ